MGARGNQTGRTAAPAALSARVLGHVALEARRGGEIVACFDGYSFPLGNYETDTARRALQLATGIPIGALASDGAKSAKEIVLLVRRLARHGLVEYRLGASPKGKDLVVIEPQMPDYWPQLPLLLDTDVIVLSRFAYMRRRGNDMVLESPRAGGLFRIQEARLAGAIAMLSTPQQVGQLRRRARVPVCELLSLLFDCQILFKVDPAGDGGLRASEGDDHLVLWDFHDLLFHARSMEGRHASPSGGTYPYIGLIAPEPALRSGWLGEKIDLCRFSADQAVSPLGKLLQQRHSTREFNDHEPITLAELARFLDGAARVRARWTSKLAEFGADAPEIEYASRPYPAAGAGYELELYLAVDKCDGLARGFYHYDAGEHALAAIGVPTGVLDLQLAGAQFGLGASGLPQIVITIAARFGRISWKYRSIAYALVLKDAGVMIQTLYLVAVDMGLGACAIGSANIDLFAKMTGVEFHIEGPVGQLALGRGLPQRAASNKPKAP